MLKENLLMLRNINGYSQEEIAEKINISRQAYAKWESGATLNLRFQYKTGCGPCESHGHWYPSPPDGSFRQYRIRRVLPAHGRP